MEIGAPCLQPMLKFEELNWEFSSALIIESWMSPADSRAGYSGTATWGIAKFMLQILCNEVSQNSILICLGVGLIVVLAMFLCVFYFCTALPLHFLHYSL